MTYRLFYMSRQNYYIYYIIVWPPTPLFIKGLTILENHRREDQDFLVKMGEGGGRGGLVRMGGLSIQDGGSTVFNKFFIWNIYFSFDSFWYLRLFCFRLNLGLVLLIKMMLIKKASNVALCLFYCLSGVLLGRYCQ